MNVSIINPTKKPRGRPAVDSQQVNMRIRADMLKLLDSYMEQNGIKTRAEAIRRILAEFFEK